MMGKVVEFPTDNMSLGDAIIIVKHGLDIDTCSLGGKLIAIEKVAHMETHNSITKADLIKSLRWLFDHYDFEKGR